MYYECARKTTHIFVQYKECTLHHIHNHTLVNIPYVTNTHLPTKKHMKTKSSTTLSKSYITLILLFNDSKTINSALRYSLKILICSTCKGLLYTHSSCGFATDPGVKPVCV